MTTGPVQQYGNIGLTTNSGVSQGSLRLSSAGLQWKRSAGGKIIDLSSTDIKTLQWSRIQKGCALRVERSDGSLVTFVGFRESDFGELSAAAPAKVAEVPASTSGHNWGRVSLQGSSLLFHVGDSPALCIPLPDVGQAQLGRDDVLLEFPVDDTADEQHDSLVELGFYVPREGAELSLHADDGSVVRVGQRVKAEEGEDGEKAEEGDEASAVIPAKVLYERVLEHSAAGLATGDAIVSFDQVGILVPRGRFDVEMYAGSLKLLGQTQDFRVSYSTILRVFVLPKSNVPQTLVAVSLDPPIRKGQTFYPHILCQFSSDEEVSVELAISEEALAAKNEKQGGRLQASYSGPAAEVFAKTLRGLSGAKLTKPGAFRDAEGSGFAVRCSYKADDGYLYPLERAFFYVHKPPLLVVFDEVDHVEFMRPAQGVTAAKTFDLAVRTNQGHEHLFRGIPRGEWTNLFEFIQAKQLRIENFKEAQRGPGATTVGYDLQGLDEGVDEDEEDEDFNAESVAEDSSESENSDLEPEEASHAPKQQKVSETKKKTKAVETAGTAKKARKTKDKDAPKRGMSAYMFFSQEIREKVKEEKPDLAFAEMGREVGQRWKDLSAEDKKPYEERAAQDKTRYEEEMAAYREKQGAARDEEEADAGAEDGDAAE